MPPGMDEPISAAAHGLGVILCGTATETWETESEAMVTCNSYQQVSKRPLQWEAHDVRASPDDAPGQVALVQAWLKSGANCHPALSGKHGIGALGRPPGGGGGGGCVGK